MVQKINGKKRLYDDGLKIFNLLVLLCKIYMVVGKNRFDRSNA